MKSGNEARLTIVPGHQDRGKQCLVDRSFS